MSRHKALITRTKWLGGIALRATFAALFVLSAAPVAAITSPESLHTVYAQATDDIDAIEFDAFMSDKTSDYDTNTELQNKFTEKRKQVLASLKQLLRENLNNFKKGSDAATFGEIPVDDRYTNIQHIVNAWQQNPFETSGYYRYLNQMTGNDGEKILSCAHRDSFLSDGNSHIDDRYNLWWALRDVENNKPEDCYYHFRYFAHDDVDNIHQDVHLTEYAFAPTVYRPLETKYFKELLKGFKVRYDNLCALEHHKDYADAPNNTIPTTFFRAKQDPNKSVWYSDRIITKDDKVFLRTQFAFSPLPESEGELSPGGQRQCWNADIPLHCLGTFVKKLRVALPKEKIVYKKPEIYVQRPESIVDDSAFDPLGINNAVWSLSRDIDDNKKLKLAIKRLFKQSFIDAMKKDCSISREQFEEAYKKATVDFCIGSAGFSDGQKLSSVPFADAVPFWRICFAIHVPGLQTQIYPLHEIWQSLDDSKAAASKKIAAMEIPQELKTSSTAEIAKAQDQNVIDAVVDNAAAKDTNAPAEEDSGTCPSQTSDASTQTVEDTKTTDASTQTDENASTTQSADTSTQTDAGTGSPSNTGSCSTSCAGAIAPSTTNGDAKPTLMYRLYNPYSHEHLFSTDTCERNYLTRIGWKDEGIVGAVSLMGTEGGVYRLYNSSTGEHHYTSDTDELKRCVDAGWKNEGIMFYSQGDVKMVSMYNPYEKKFYHHYTSDEDEIAKMVKAGWKREEVKWRCSSRW